MTEQKFINLLKQHIFNNHGTQAEAARHWQVSANFVSLLVTGQRLPTRQMLDDMGLEILKTTTTTIKYKKVKR